MCVKLLGPSVSAVLFWFGWFSNLILGLLPNWSCCWFVHIQTCWLYQWLLEYVRAAVVNAIYLFLLKTTCTNCWNKNCSVDNTCGVAYMLTGMMDSVRIYSSSVCILERKKRVMLTESRQSSSSFCDFSNWPLSSSFRVWFHLFCCPSNHDLSRWGTLKGDSRSPKGIWGSSASPSSDLFAQAWQS